MGILSIYGIVYVIGSDAKEIAIRFSSNTDIPIDVSVAIIIIIPIGICVSFVISSFFFWYAMEGLKKEDRAYYDYMCSKSRKMVIVIISLLLVAGIFKAALEIAYG